MGRERNIKYKKQKMFYLIQTTIVITAAPRFRLFHKHMQRRKRSKMLMHYQKKNRNKKKLLITLKTWVLALTKRGTSQSFSIEKIKVKKEKYRKLKASVK